MNSLQRYRFPRVPGRHTKARITIMRYVHLKTIFLVFSIAAGTFMGLNAAVAGTAMEIDHDVDTALKELYAQSSSASR
ncbi:MAG: hypothetical protein MUO68_21110 [Desulfobacteraceae bacterium]|nr:hypothetical protein [Desulfobacteraceae bacterium]